MPFDFAAAVTAPHRMQPGLRRMADGAPTVTALRPGSPAFDDKLAVLHAQPDEALLCMPGFDPMPALRVLAGEAARHAPSTIEVDAAGLTALHLGLHTDWQGLQVTAAAHAHPAAQHCIERLPPAQRVAALLGLSLHEDVALLDGDSTRLPWMAVCLPSHWAPRDKLGRPFAEVHGPVADNATLLAAGAHLARLVCQPQRWERFVWTVTTHRRHDQHPARHARSAWPANAQALVAAAVWRTEHQRFLPLPTRRHALFTIHVEWQPLADAIDTPARAAALHAALSSMSAAVLDYRGLTAARPALLDWLADRAALRSA